MPSEARLPRVYNKLVVQDPIQKFNYRQKSLGKKIWFRLKSLGKILVPITPRCGKKVQARPAKNCLFIFQMYKLADQFFLHHVCLKNILFSWAIFLHLMRLKKPIKWMKSVMLMNWWKVWTPSQIQLYYVWMESIVILEIVHDELLLMVRNLLPCPHVLWMSLKHTHGCRSLTIPHFVLTLAWSVIKHFIKKCHCYEDPP